MAKPMINGNLSINDNGTDSGITLTKLKNIMEIISPVYLYQDSGAGAWYYLFHLTSTSGWNNSTIAFIYQAYNRDAYGIGYITYYNNGVTARYSNMSSYVMFGYIKNDDNSLDIFVRSVRTYQPAFVKVLYAMHTRNNWFNPYIDGYPKICSDDAVIEKITQFTGDVTDSLYTEITSFGTYFEPYDNDNYRTPACKKLNGVIYLKGLINVKQELTDSEDIICTLSEEFRPSQRLYVNLCGSCGEYSHNMDACPATIRPDGTIRLHNGHAIGWISLDGINYLQD